MIDLGRSARFLLPPSHPALDEGGDATELAALVCTTFDAEHARLFPDREAACRALAEAARRAKGRAHCLAWLPFSPQDRDVPGWERLASLDQLPERLRAGDVAAVLVEPASEVLDAARACGTLVVFDESETAFRLAPGALEDEVRARADAVLVDEALSGGRAFAAVAARGQAFEGDPGTASSEAVRAACATLRVLANDVDYAVRLRTFSDALVHVFDEGCRRDDLHARLVGGPGRLVFEFDGQEGAPPELIREHFLKELGERGLHCEGVLYPSAWLSEDERDRACAALDANVMRARALLIEFNSFLSGGVPYVFPTDSSTLKERGIALYRFPREAPVKVSADEAGMRIDVRPGPLGDVTSSGFYIPTRIRGDFSVRARYSIEHWQPGDVAACLALFVQDEPSLVRYYAQQMSSAEDGESHWLLASFTGELSARRPAPGHDGEFRIDREGTVARCWHRFEGGEWELLGEHDQGEAPEMYVGAKIWSSGESGGLRAYLSELTIVGDIPGEQPPPVPVRPDPVD